MMLRLDGLRRQEDVAFAFATIRESVQLQARGKGGPAEPPRWRTVLEEEGGSWQVPVKLVERAYMYVRSL